MDEWEIKRRKLNAHDSDVARAIIEGIEYEFETKLEPEMKCAFESIIWGSLKTYRAKHHVGLTD